MSDAVMVPREPTEAMIAAGSAAAARCGGWIGDGRLIETYKAMLAASTPVEGWEADRDAVAEAVHKGRFPDDREPTPFADEDRSGREYCYRIADRVLALAPPPPSVSMDNGSRPQEAVPTEGHDTEVLSLRAALKSLLTACYSADAGDGLPDEIDGSLLDAGEAALGLQFPVIWTPEQVAMLEARQAAPMSHPYTCGGNRSDALHKAQAEEDGDDDTGVLIPTVRGWICPACDYRQFWSHETGKPTPQPADGCSSNEGADGCCAFPACPCIPGQQCDVVLGTQSRPGRQGIGGAPVPQTEKGS